MVEVHQPAYALTCRFSPDVTKLATTSSDRTAKVWDIAADFELKLELTGHSQWVWDCAFSADAEKLVTVRGWTEAAAVVLRPSLAQQFCHSR